MVENREHSPRPLTLHDAGRAIRKLPGAEHYIRQDTVDPLEIDEGIEKLIDELMDHLDAQNMRTMITNFFGWSDKKADNFFSHLSRQPFQSEMKFSQDPEERTEQLITVGTYLRLRYEDAQEKAEDDSPETKKTIQKAGQKLRNFSLISVQNLFSDSTYDFVDKVNGIDPTDRHEGTINPTHSILEVFQDASQKATEEDGKWEEIYKEALVATEGGNLQIAHTFLRNKRGSLKLRRTLALALEARNADEQLKIEKLQLVWKADALRQRMGIDWEMYLKINGMPDSQTVENKIISFLQNPASIQSTLKHLEKEAPNAYSAIEDGRQVNYFAMLSERAETREFSDNPETLEDLVAKKERVWNKLGGIMPLGFEEIPTVYIDAPVAKGTSPRAYSMDYSTSQRKQFYTALVNPREEEGIFEAFTGHELIHQLHKRLLDVAEDKGELQPDTSVPSRIKEALALLVEEELRRMNTQQHTPQIESSSTGHEEYPDLAYAIKQRKDGPWALTQQAVRLSMEKLWNQGVKELSEKDARAIIQEIDPKIEDWGKIGVPISSFPYGLTINPYVNPLDPLDGLIYLESIVNEAPNALAKSDEKATVIFSQEKKPQDMKSAFEERFETGWLSNPDARIILYGLLLESGKNHDITTYPEYISRTNVDEIKSQLGRLDIDLSQV